MHTKVTPHPVGFQSSEQCLNKVGLAENTFIHAVLALLNTYLKPKLCGSVLIGRFFTPKNS